MQSFRPGGFSIPTVVKNLLIINVLVFFAQFTFQNNQSFNIESFFALHDVRSVYFKPHQIITYMFLHGGFDHLFFNMLGVWMFGSALEEVWGAKRFLFFYIICGIGAALLHLVTLYFEMNHIVEIFRRLSPEEQEVYRYAPTFKLNGATLGASGSLFGCLAAFAYLFPNTPIIMLFFPVPIKAKWFVMIYAGIELFMGVRNSAGDNVAHWAHLGGALVGILIVLYWNKNNRRRFY